jgi:hypothetical protein
MTINDDKTLITMFTEPVLRLCSSQYFWPKADFVLTTLGRNQKPRGQKSRGRIFGFFKPISCYPPLFFADSSRFQADKAVLHEREKIVAG